jgi:hypothetical protein
MFHVKQLYWYNSTLYRGHGCTDAIGKKSSHSCGTKHYTAPNVPILSLNYQCRWFLKPESLHARLALSHSATDWRHRLHTFSREFLMRFSCLYAFLRSGIAEIIHSNDSDLCKGMPLSPIHILAVDWLGTEFCAACKASNSWTNANGENFQQIGKWLVKSINKNEICRRHYLWLEAA